MLLLDTNVLSEIMKGRSAERSVRVWLDAQPSAELATCAICIAELRIGAANLDAGRKRQNLETSIDQIIALFPPEFILPFDTAAANGLGIVMEQRRRAGRPISRQDAMIAAIARANGATLVTRDVGDFAGLGLSLVDPWSA